MSPRQKYLEHNAEHRTSGNRCPQGSQIRSVSEGFRASPEGRRVRHRRSHIGMGHLAAHEARNHVVYRIPESGLWDEWQHILSVSR